MANYHSVSKGNGETTQWEDAQVKLGNYAPREKPPPPPEWAPAEDEERFLEQYRRERLEQLRASGRASDQQQGSGVSEVHFIRRDEFVKEVTEASNKAWVVVFLFKEGNEGCMLMSKCLEQLARKYYGTKFVKIVSTDCIAKYPDSLFPTLIVYRNGKPEKNINGMGSFGGKRISPESVAYELNKLGAVCSLGGEAEEASQVEVIKSAVDRLILERELEDMREEADLDN